MKQSAVVRPDSRDATAGSRQRTLVFAGLVHALHDGFTGMMGLLLFLPFLLKAKGASLTTVGLALSLIFIGGAFGKAACGWLGARLGLLATVVATEAGTAVAILTVLVLPLASSLALLPL